MTDFDFELAFYVLILYAVVGTLTILVSGSFTWHHLVVLLGFYFAQLAVLRWMRLL